MGHFVALSTCDALLCLQITFLGVSQIYACPASDETPVFHCPEIKVARLGVIEYYVVHSDSQKDLPRECQV